MDNLNFPSFRFRIKNSEKGKLIFDIVRKKFVLLTPEEWVRQHLLHHLVHQLGYSSHLIKVEGQIAVHHTQKRFDVVAYRPDGRVYLLAECKAPQVPVDQGVFDQAARYNLATQSSYTLLTNGLTHYCCQMDRHAGQYIFIDHFPPPPEKGRKLHP